MQMMGLAFNQGGIINFLGKQPEVTEPIKAQSHADSPPVQLAYITDAEKDLLVKANIHGSMAGKPNPGPAGIASLDDFFTTTDDKGNVQIGGGGGEQVFSYEQGDTQGAGGYTPQTGVGSGQGVTDEGKLGYYAQVGPGFVHTEADDETVTEISGKVGVSVAVADGADVYGEISGITGEDSSGDDIIDFGGKVGVKYTF